MYIQSIKGQGCQNYSHKSSNSSMHLNIFENTQFVTFPAWTQYTLKPSQNYVGVCNMELRHIKSLSKKMNSLNKSVSTAVNCEHSGVGLSVRQHLRWQTGILLVRTKNKEVAFASAINYYRSRFWFLSLADTSPGDICYSRLCLFKWPV